MLIISIIYITIKSKDSNKIGNIIILLSLWIIWISNNNEIILYNNNINIYKWSWLVWILCTLCYILLKDKDFILYSILGTMLIVWSNSKLIFVISLEIQSFSMFLLISKYKTIYALMYFLLSSVSTVYLIYGIETSKLLWIIALIYKLSLFPLHTFYVELYNNLPINMLVIVMNVPKLSILLSPIMELIDKNILLISMATILAGGLGGLITNKLAKIITYSSINQIGIIILIINQSDSNIIILYIFQYILTSMILMKLLPNNTKLLCNISKYNKVIVIVMLLSLMSMPITLGFYSKLYVINIITINKEWIILGLVLLTSIMTSYYYLNIINNLLKTNMVYKSTTDNLALTTLVTILVGLVIVDYKLIMHLVLYIMEC